MANIIDKDEYEMLKSKYSLTDNVIIKLLKLRLSIRNKTKKALSLDDLVEVLKMAMNYDEMHILLKKQSEGIDITLNELLSEFFKLNNEERILNLFEIVQKNNLEKNNDLNDDFSIAPESLIKTKK